VTALVNKNYGNGKPITVWLQSKTVRKLDKAVTRGYYSRSQLVQIAADRLLQEIDYNNSALQGSRIETPQSQAATVAVSTATEGVDTND
jgi:metal-responsive CopG/Arc/MetJ family transcriptional regulator